MSIPCLDGTSCLGEPPSLGVPAANDAESSWSLGMTSTELARELSIAALQCHSVANEQSLSILERLVRNAAAHVRRRGVSTVDHIVLSATLRTISRDIPSVASILQDEGWQWFQSRAR